MWHEEFRRRLLRPPAADPVPADGLEPRPSDGVPMTVWANVSHEQMAAEVTTNANPAAVAESAQEWLRIADELQQHERAVRRAIEESRGDWRGAGGDAVRRHLTKVADWLATTARGAQQAGRQQQAHAQALEEARRRMAANPPVAFSVAEANARLQGITDPVAYARQLAEDTRLRDAQEAAHAEAVRIMTEFDRALAQAVVTPFFAAPPELPGVAVRSGLTRDGAGVGGVPGFGGVQPAAVVTSGAGGVPSPDSVVAEDARSRAEVPQPDSVTSDGVRSRVDATAGVPPFPQPDSGVVGGLPPGSVVSEGLRSRVDAAAGVPPEVERVGAAGIPPLPQPDSGVPGGLPPGSGVPGGLPPDSVVSEELRPRVDAAAGVPPGLEEVRAAGVPPLPQPDSRVPGGLPPGSGVPGGLPPGPGVPGGLPPGSGVPGGLPPGSVLPGGVSPHSDSTGVSGARLVPPIPPLPPGDPAVAAGVPPLPPDPPVPGGTGGPGRVPQGVGGLGRAPRLGSGEDARSRRPRLGAGGPGGSGMPSAGFGGPGGSGMPSAGFGGPGGSGMPPAGSGAPGGDHGNATGSGTAALPERSGTVRDTPAGTSEPPRTGQPAPLAGVPRPGGKPAEDDEHRVADYLEADPELFAVEQPVVPPTLGDWKKNKIWRKQP
ncbi:PPE-repeat protein [Amycolatopsis tolypomycina]|uniref:PPE-repeat protein n=1 Tax=Amycolatopsis tolypomycina TaxID=208445 RepID=A0A1H5AS21_9PSEU|nr:PPE domain-containing protein [Amycolatopsis tolypomycina]SED44748.1 PPE-repeat protein [Amycolatopsis tolypomycina]